ncbi:MAG TPA: hypothetical protein VMU41_16925 [Candidatus Binataceae bacterium]|nr:hypothetical protein [Candidatus Binataceae bacterium]
MIQRIERTRPVRKNDTVRTLLLTSLIISVAAVLGACGVKSAPVPPEKARPERITSLTAASVQDGIMLKWNRPLTYSGGNTMRDLGGFVIMRAEGDTAEMQPLVEIPVTDQERFQVQMVFTYDDQETQIGAHYRYAIIAETTDGYRSDPSNVVEITRVKPPPPPNPANFPLPTPVSLPT